MMPPSSHLDLAWLPFQPPRVSPCFLSCHTLVLRIMKGGCLQILASPRWSFSVLSSSLGPNLDHLNFGFQLSPLAHSPLASKLPAPLAQIALRVRFMAYFHSYSHGHASQGLLCLQFSIQPTFYSGFRPPALAHWFRPSSPSLSPLCVSCTLSQPCCSPWPRTWLVSIRVSPTGIPDPGQGCSLLGATGALLWPAVHSYQPYLVLQTKLEQKISAATLN